MHSDTQEITDLMIRIAKQAHAETPSEHEAEMTKRKRWPISCTVGPGLEGAIACQSKVGYVNGTHGRLIYRGYDIFDLCAHSNFEEVTYLLLKGRLPTVSQLNAFKTKLVRHRNVHDTLRMLMGFPIEDMNSMAGLRLGTNLMRQEFTFNDYVDEIPDGGTGISVDEDSIPMETVPKGEPHAIYEFDKRHHRDRNIRRDELEGASGIEACYQLIAGVPTIAAAISRVQRGHLPIEPDPELGHAANYLYMITGKRPTPVQERIMDIALILHADHGMNAGTFATLVVASTLSDVFFSIGSGIAALNGPLHGGANARVVGMLKRIGSPDNVEKFCRRAKAKKERIPGFGHRVYKTYDPRAKVLGPLVDYLSDAHPDTGPLLKTAKALEKHVIKTLGADKGIYPNVDFYSGLVYSCMGVHPELFTPTFAVARVAGWTARVLEYLLNNRIFRPRALYVGPLDKQYTPIEERQSKR